MDDLESDTLPAGGRMAVGAKPRRTHPLSSYLLIFGFCRIAVEPKRLRR